MGKELTADQRAFIEQFLIGKSAGESKKIEAAFLDFDRRCNKVKIEIGKLTGDDAKLLQTWLKAVVARAESGDFRGAYEELDGIKQNARALVQDSTGALPIEAIMRALRPQLAEIGNLTATAAAGMAELIKSVDEHAKPSSCKTYDEACAFRRQLTEEEAIWRGSFVSYQRYVERAAAIARQPMVDSVLSQLAARIDAMPPSDKRTAFNRQFGELIDLAQQPLRPISAQGIGEGSRPLREEFETRIIGLKDFRNPSFTDTQREAFAELEGQQRALLDSAMARVAGAVGRDGEVLDPSAVGATPPTPRALRKFRLDELATSANGAAAAGPLTFDDATIQAMCDDLTNKMATEFGGGDRILDLTLKSAAEMQAELAAMLGLPKDPGQWGAQAAPVAKAAEKLRQVIRDNNPNKRTDDQIVLNGKTYKRKQIVGAGGMGIVERFIDPTTQQAVIVKRVKFADVQAQFIDEARTHWQLSGGESGTGDPHVVKMHGVAVDPGGGLSIVMEEAEGGDLDIFANALNECCRMGIIPAAARNALTQDIARQAAEGLKAVHQQNELHFDLKAKNFFVDADGKVVIGDFGTAQAMDENGTFSGHINTTPTYVAPEWRGENPTYTTGTDVFMLGAMMQGLQSDIMIEGEEQKVAKYGEFDRLRSGNDATAFDRLRNAMLDPDPAKRPSLDGVLASAYVGAATSGFDQQDVDALAGAVACYSKAVGKAVLELSRYRNMAIGGKRARAKPSGGGAKAEAESLASLRQELAEINEKPEVKQLLEAIRRASLPFGGTMGRDAAADEQALSDAKARALAAGGGTDPRMAAPMQKELRQAQGSPAAAKAASDAIEDAAAKVVASGGGKERPDLYDMGAAVGRVMA